ncbi:LysM peptidoglycan-binding domain-containing protein [Leifsonia poae]|uniref:LysM peptidoglycan-binding domain-containing protein n=1 Tax=Leifsonia poae TaxID=110933 RepID=UPI001CC0063A|nr:LysM peptidoglycan-binding domain-containing protein [Leifsonia poae]
MSTATVTMSPSGFTVPEGATTRLHLTRRGRVVFTSLAAVPLVIGALVFALNGGGAAASGEQAHVQFHYVTVSSGQSLWSIAEKVAPSADPRDVIADIVSLNQLDTAVVSPGQRIAIPAQYEH